MRQRTSSFSNAELVLRALPDALLLQLRSNCYASCKQESNIVRQRVLIVGK